VSPRELLHTRSSIDRELEKRRTGDQPHDLFHFRPSPDENRSALVHGRLLGGWIEHEAPEVRCRSLGFVLADAVVSSDDDPRVASVMPLAPPRRSPSFPRNSTASKARSGHHQRIPPSSRTAHSSKKRWSFTPAPPRAHASQPRHRMAAPPALKTWTVAPDENRPCRVVADARSRSPRR
jgi:hypothetical protein